MQLTKKTIAAIKKTVARVCGGRRLIQVSERSDETEGKFDSSMNVLMLGGDTDFIDATDLDEMGDVQIDEDPDGFVALDLYCYDDEELDTNVYVLLGPDQVVLYGTKDFLNGMDKIREMVAVWK